MRRHWWRSDDRDIEAAKIAQRYMASLKPVPGAAGGKQPPVNTAATVDFAAMASAAAADAVDMPAPPAPGAAVAGSAAAALPTTTAASKPADAVLSEAAPKLGASSESLTTPMPIAGAAVWQSLPPKRRTAHASKKKAAESKIERLERGLLPHETAARVPRTVEELHASAAQHPLHHAAAGAAQTHPLGEPIGLLRLSQDRFGIEPGSG